MFGACGGSGTAFSSWTSLGKNSAVTVRAASALRIARSIAWRAWAGLVTVTRYSLATSA